MRFIKYMVVGFLLVLASTFHASGQANTDSLRYLLDNNNPTDADYAKTAAKLCGAIANTELSYLIPDYATYALESDPGNKDIQTKFALYGYLGNYYWQIGKLTEAANQFSQMRLLGETSTDTLIIASSLNGLGTVYYLMENYSQALAYYQKAMSMSGSDSLLLGRLYNNIANSFTQLGEMDSVIPYYERAIEFHKLHNNYRYLSNAYANIALAYGMLHDRRAVERNIDLAMAAARKANDPFQIATVYQNMGDLVYDAHRELAGKMYGRALELARQIKSFELIRTNLDSLSAISILAGDFKTAAGYLTEIKELDDSLNHAQRISLVRQMESEHMASLRRAEEMSRENQENIKIVREESHQRITIFILLAGLATLLIIMALGFQAYRLRMKITQTKEKFFSMIAHDIRNPFSGILGISSILYEKAENSDDPVHRRQVRALHKSLNQVYDLLENLLQWSQAETGKIAFHPAIQSLHPFVNEVICLHYATGKQKGIKIENQIQSDLKARFDSNMLQTIIRNLLSNAIKFSPENSTIFIAAEIKGKSVIVKVRDEGLGMTEIHADKVFNSNEGLSTLGTRQENGSGLGITICKSFVKTHGGKIWTETSPNKGTSVFFSLPD